MEEDYQWDAETRRLREDGMAADGSRLNPGDMLEDGSTWYPGWPDRPRMRELGPDGEEGADDRQDDGADAAERDGGQVPGLRAPQARPQDDPGDPVR
jgi:hypothetical protein